MPNYVARKSCWSVVTFWSILACILIIPIFILIYRIIAAKKSYVEFYEDKIISYKGIINVQKKQVVFMGVTGVSISQRLKGRVFGFGDVNVDCVGKWDVDTTGIKNPTGLESYLLTKVVKVPTNHQFVQI